MIFLNFAPGFAIRRAGCAILRSAAPGCGAICLRIPTPSSTSGCFCAWSSLKISSPIRCRSTNREAGIDYLIEHTKASGESLVFSIVGKGDLPLIESVFPAAFIRPERDYFDYLYETQDLLDLVGRPHKSTRNHISKFLRMYQDYAFERIDESNLAEARTFIETYLKNVVLEKDYPSLLEERIKVLEVLDNLELYGMFGGVLTVSGEIVGLSLGEFCGDTLFVHTEKALTDFAGAYQMLMHEFLKSFATDPDIVYVNREDDSGDEGLRRSKMSYNPIRLIEKYTVFTEGEPAGDEKDCV